MSILRKYRPGYKMKRSPSYLASFANTPEGHRQYKFVRRAVMGSVVGVERMYKKYRWGLRATDPMKHGAAYFDVYVILRRPDWSHNLRRYLKSGRPKIRYTSDLDKALQICYNNRIVTDQQKYDFTIRSLDHD